MASIQLIQNGGFEDGLVGVNSDYRHMPRGNSDESTHWIAPHDPGIAWGPRQSGTNLGRMNVNGADSSFAATNRVWWQTVNVMAGITYEFSAQTWATHAGEDGYQLRVAYDDVQIGNTRLGSQAGLWESFNALYLATLTGRIEICVVNVSNKTFPNDFMLDDISLTGDRHRRGARAQHALRVARIGRISGHRSLASIAHDRSRFSINDAKPGVVALKSLDDSSYRPVKRRSDTRRFA